MNEAVRITQRSATLALGVFSPWRHQGGERKAMAWTLVGRKTRESMESSYGVSENTMGSSNARQTS